VTKLAANKDQVTSNETPPSPSIVLGDPAKQSEQPTDSVTDTAVDAADVAAGIASVVAHPTSTATTDNLLVNNLPGMPETTVLPENRSCTEGSGPAKAQRTDVRFPALAQSMLDTFAVGTKKPHPQLPEAASGPRATDDAIWEAMEKAAQLSSDGLFWEVIAGVNDGGIPVNDTADSTSQEIGKLAHGALVRQAGLHGGCLQYELLAGSGPRTGWVCLQKGGQQLLTTAAWAARLSCVNLVPGSRRTLFIFDWDDTLLPLAWLESQPGMKLGKPPKVRSGKMWEQLADHARVVESTLAAARALGEVAIVTLSQRPWVDSSAQNFMPSALHQVQQTRVLYGREFAHAKLSVDEDYWISLKHSAMHNALETMSGSSDTPWMNLVSIGDSIIEKRAAMSLGSTCRKSGSVKWTKTIKFKDRPWLNELTAQLRTLQGLLADVVAREGDYHLSATDLRC
jgi:hypothetical protein